MKTIQQLILLITFFSFIFSAAIAQNLGEKILNNSKRTLERRTENAVDRTLNKGIDKVEQGAENTVKGDNKKNKSKKSKEVDEENSNDKNNNPDTQNDKSDNKTNTNHSSKKENTSLAVYSKFDFVPGEKVIAAEDFSQDAIGDYPARWNTNGSGEVVTLNNSTTRYLKTNSECVFYPEWISNLPENFTVEFDLYSTEEYSFYSGWFVVGFTSEKNVSKNFRQFARFGDGRIANGGGFEIGLHPGNAGNTAGRIHVHNSFNKTKIIENENEQKSFTVNKIKKNYVHVSISRQKGRVRVYLDENKVIDIPRLCPDEVTTLNSIYFRNEGGNPEKEAYFLSNLSVAVGKPDTRSKLITEGKLSTTGIKFDSGSDQIKPESYGTLKEIADVLKENSNVRIKIIGHTDSDGSADANLELSKKRAASVKSALVKEFGIDAGRMETDGKGQNEPVDTNNTPQGKANNRRVEFIKL